MIAWLLALALAAPAGTPAPEPKGAPGSNTASKPARWRTSIDATTLAKSGDLNITVTLRGFDELDAVCLDMPRAAASVQDLTIVGGEKLPVDPDDANCFPLPDKRPSPLVVRYRFELKSLASRTGDPDWASRGPGGDYVFNEESVLLRPEPMPLHEPREIEVVLAPGQRVAPPWTKAASARPDAAQFTTNADQYDAGSYIALGNLTFLDDVQMPVGAYGVTLLSGPVRVPYSVLRGWVATAGRAVSDFYGGVPGGRAHVILMPEPGSKDGGL
ncbi:MAG: hypothetical protein JST92_17245, partial [Deltaproteobacteria bacterium]|nr:hypothetical protein [Deltaproteobacteria bacterium]